MTTKRIVFVIGATGSVGAATVRSLAAKYGDKIDLRAGVRDPEKAEKIESLAGATIVQATMGDDKLAQVLSGVHILFIVTPGTKDRVQLTLSTGWLAKTAGVKYMAVVSVLTADLINTTFGRQFTEIEAKISKIGVPYTFIRLPLFIENYWLFKDTIVNQGTIYCPVDPEKPYTPVAVEDVGNALATILVNPSRYTNKAIDLVSDCQTFNEVAQGFSTALGKEVKYVRVPYEAAKESFLDMGFPEWQVNGILELYKLIDCSNPVMFSSDGETVTKITGGQPTDLKKWLAKYAGGFQN